MENWEDSEEAKHSAADFHNSNEDVRMAVHGDDFVCLSDDDGFKTHKLFKSKYTATDMGTLEFEESDGKKSSIVCLGFETQASWLRADKSALPVLERPWLEKITAHSRIREKPLLPTAAVSLSKGGAQPSFRPF